MVQGKEVQERTDFVLDAHIDGFAGAGDTCDVGRDLLRRTREAVGSGQVVRWIIPAISPIVYRLEGIVSLARDEGVEPVLVPAEYAGIEGQSSAKLAPDEKLFLWDFVTYRFLGIDSQLLRPGQRIYYKYLAEYFDGRIGSASKLAELSAAVVAGDLIDVSPDSYDFEDQGPVAEAMEVVLDGARAHLGAVGAKIRSPGTRQLEGGEIFGTVLLIGAYGGEHIGDIAILGGVICRLHEKFGTHTAVLMTQRPNHTAHLVSMLDVPVELSVDEYQRDRIDQHLAAADAVVFAGGPLIDLPKQLVRHLYAVAAARRSGKPFIAEGIGPGPFVRWPSKFTARRLMKMASRISVRELDAVKHDVVRGLDVEAGHCPAFDYLATRGNDLTRLAAAEPAAIEELLEDTDGRPVIAVNIRPIGHMYTVGASGEDKAAYTRRIEDRFERRFASALEKFSRKSAAKPCFVFFPMNAIQFGQSDLLSAYRIKRYLTADVDFRVWQADASLDAIVALLRRSDTAITMRFHATIFAMSQQCRVIGIDYRIGKRDKIAGLMDDAGEGEFCARIDLMTDDWLVESLEKLA